MLIGRIGSLVSSYGPSNYVDPGEGWPISKEAIRGRFDLVGPYFEDCWGGHGSDLGAGTHGVEDSSRRRYVVARCKQAISIADIIFAWIDDLEAYGSLWELGYATGRVPIIVVAVSYGLHLDDFWFATEHAQAHYVAPSASQAWDYFLCDWPDIQKRHATSIPRLKLLNGRQR